MTTGLRPTHVTVAIAALLLIGVATTPATAQKTVYREIGGYDALAALTDGWLERIAADPVLADAVAGVAESERPTARQLLVDLLCWASGGPCVDVCTHLRTLAGNPALDDDHWRRAVTHMNAELTKQGLTDRDWQRLEEVLERVRQLLIGGSC